MPRVGLLLNCAGPYVSEYLVLLYPKKTSMFFHHASVIDNVNPIFFASLFRSFIVYSKLHPYYFISFFLLIASSITGGTSSDFLNTSTTSIFSGISVILEYGFLPNTSVVVWIYWNNIISMFNKVFWTLSHGFSSFFDIPTTAIFFNR